MWTVRDTKTQEVTLIGPDASQSLATVDSSIPAISSNNKNKLNGKKRKRNLSTAPTEKNHADPVSNDKRKRKKQNKGSRSKGKAVNGGEAVHLDFNSIPWAEVQPGEGFLMGDNQAPGGFLCLEEIDGVDVEYETGEGAGKILKFKKVKEHEVKGRPAKPDVPLEPSDMDGFIHIDDYVEGQKPEDDSAGEESTIIMDDHQDTTEHMETDTPDESGAVPSVGAETIEEDFDVTGWATLDLAPGLIEGIKALKFPNPTDIQASTLPVALDGKRDIIGAAQTGSGKTLAFGLPILQSIATRIVTSKDPGLHGLILAPTRELAMQVTDHLNAVAKFISAKVVAIVGGMSIPKQKRLISTRPDIIVATPGRLWELASQDDSLLARLRGIKFLVLDEADRMLESGHFKELDSILNAISNKRRDKPASFERRTLIFSATLIHDPRLKQKVKKPSKKQRSSAPTLDDLLERLEFQDPDPCYVNVLPEQVTADKLFETRIDCLHTEKDAYLYYILARYPGRTIVFVNSIDAIRRLVPVLTHMRVNAFGLHAEMQQRQRLKNLDRFRDTANAVLIASDVAARGLDIPNIEHVVHYQLPRTADLYVHRSGRTARASAEGVSVMLCSPQEVPVYKKICHVLRKTDGLPEFPVDRSLISGIKQRINLARKIDEAEHQKQKTQHEKNWFKKAAAEADIELDEDFLDSGTLADESKNAKKQEVDQNKIKGWKAELNALLAKPLVPKGVSGLYLTSNVDEDLPEVLVQTAGTNTKMPTQRPTNAVHDVQRASGGKKREGKNR